MNDAEELYREMLACLDRDVPDEALVLLADRPFAFEPIEGYQPPPASVGLAAMVISGALLRKGMPEKVSPLLDRFSDALAPDNRKGEGNWRMLAAFHFLHAPLIDAALALADQDRAVDLLNGCVKDMHRAGAAFGLKGDDLPIHPKTADYGPIPIDPDWLLDRHERVLLLGDLDHRLSDVQEFHAGFVECALLAEKPDRALPLIERELEWYLSCPVIGISHFEFDAICVLATLGRFDEAMIAARRLVRRGYHLAWRFRLESARDMAWTQAMRQNEWLLDLSETPAYRQFLKEALPAPMLGDEPEVNPLCAVRDGVWSGKKNKRCAVSRKFIKPGDAVVRFRKLFNRSSDGDLDMAASEAFLASPWQTARQQFETDSIPLAMLFPRNMTRDAKLDDAPHIHAFVYDLAREPGSLNIDQAAMLIADHAPPPIGYSWNKGGRADRWAPAFPLFAGADGHGDAVNLTWRLIKAGQREPLLRAVSGLPEAKADKVFAMLATFDDGGLRQAAAEHFRLPLLPQIMETVFKDRLTYQDHGTLADFGGQNGRYRAGLVSAMQAYGLHLYSNYRPKPDWFLAGLEHYTRAGGSALLYFLIDHPEDDPVLDTVIRERWLPDKCAGSIVEYGNACPFYVRAALFHNARHRPEELAIWLSPEFVRLWSDMAYDRETLRLAKHFKTAECR